MDENIRSQVANCQTSISFQPRLRLEYGKNYTVIKQSIEIDSLINLLSHGSARGVIQSQWENNLKDVENRGTSRKTRKRLIIELFLLQVKLEKLVLVICYVF